MSGAKIAIKYGYVPCRMGLCGPEEGRNKKIIDRYLKGERGAEKYIKKIIREFRGAYPYYRLIASSNKISDPLDRRVVEAYWSGNSLLEKVRFSDYARMMEKEFLPLGKMPREKIEKLPEFAIPFHSFHVLFIGSVTGKFQETPKGLDLCRVSWGQVRKVGKKRIAVLRQPLKFGKKVNLGIQKIEKINWNRDILPEIKVGEWVSLHWGTAIEKLDNNKLKNIKKYTHKILGNGK